MPLGLDVSNAAKLEIEVRSAHGPDVTLGTAELGGAVDDALAGDDGAGPSIGSRLKRWFLEWLRPELTVRTAFGTVHKAPGGPAPARSTWPLVPLVLAAALLAVLVLAVVGVVSLVRR